MPQTQENSLPHFRKIKCRFFGKSTCRLHKLLRQAKLRYPAADLDRTIYDPDRLLDTAAIESLSTCGWIDEGRNLLISGKSSSGKTYLANALSVAALRQFKTVRYIKASRLMSELEQARIKDVY